LVLDPALLIFFRTDPLLADWPVNAELASAPVQNRELNDRVKAPAPLLGTDSETLLTALLKVTESWLERLPKAEMLI
jgi:hypothetical protein